VSSKENINLHCWKSFDTTPPKTTSPPSDPLAGIVNENDIYQDVIKTKMGKILVL
jgi:hypothetical protein